MHALGVIKVGRPMGLQALLGYRVAVAVASFRTIFVNTGRGKRTMPALCPRRPWVYIKQDKIQRGLLRRAARGALLFHWENISVLIRSDTKPLFSHTKTFSCYEFNLFTYFAIVAALLVLLLLQLSLTKY